MKHLFTLLIFSFSLAAAFGQNNKLQIADQYLAEMAEEWGLVSTDIVGYQVSDNYTSKKSGVNHIYLKQTHNGIPVYNAITTVNVTKEGKVLLANNKFISNLASKVNEPKASLDPSVAITNALIQLGEILVDEPQLKSTRSNSSIYTSNLVHNDIDVSLSYQPMKDGSVKLAWDLAMDLKSSPDYWSVRVDAVTGELLSQDNWTVYCNVDHIKASHATHNCSAHAHDVAQQSFTAVAASTDSSGCYFVYPFPAESPLESEQILVVDPADPVASPFGWHDTNGVEGAEFTYTQGNNVNAYLDIDDNNAPDGLGPEGGDALIFNSVHDQSLNPDQSLDAAQINLFYAINFIHDFAYNRGFDEESGNFQTNNYGNGGLGGDHVLGEAHDGSGTNNANFATPPDGGSGRMQMFLWDNATSGALRIDSPGTISGIIGQSGAGEFGPPVGEVAVTGSVSAVEDGSGIDEDGCEEIDNDLTGKIALIERGGCFFWEKTLNAQEAGAVAALICNIPGADSPTSDGETVIGMAGEPTSPINIPSLFLAKSSCDRIKSGLATGEDVVITFQNIDVGGPERLDAAYDNGVIAHEYGHGISNRLTGGPSAAGCLGNDEQMGEGWSDFFTLVTTAKPEHDRNTARGIGSYVNAEGLGGRGIRTFPYSTDFGVNPQTYDDVKGTTAPHPLGAVWNVMLWEVYWYYVDTYGFDETWQDDAAGNVCAVEIIMEGMKLQGCNPGFVEGRDAILAADFVKFGEVNQKALWEGFARRGLGFSADGGQTSDRNDGTQAFDIPPVLIESVKVNKEVAGLVEPGEEIFVSLKVANHLRQLTENVILTDELPAGLSYISGSASMDVNEGSGILTFELGDMEFEDEIEVTYRAIVDADLSSTTAFFDDLEQGFNNWTFGDDNEGDVTWNISSTNARSGENSWYKREAEEEADQRIIYGPLAVTGTSPVFKFYHDYTTQAIFDAGFMEVSTNGGEDWITIKDDKFFRGAYNDFVDYSTFVIPSHRGWSGESNGYVDAFIDFSDYAGQDVMISWRYGSNVDGLSPAAGEGGWYFDDIELISDLVRLESQAMVTYTGGADAVRSVLTSTIVNSAPVSTSVVDADPDFFAMKLYPNPTADKVYVNIAAKAQGQATMGLYSIDGKMIKQVPIYIDREANTYQFDVSEITSGFYFVKIDSAFGTVTEKISVQ